MSKYLQAKFSSLFKIEISLINDDDDFRTQFLFYQIEIGLKEQLQRMTKMVMEESVW